MSWLAAFELDGEERNLRLESTTEMLAPRLLERRDSALVIAGELAGVSGAAHDDDRSRLETILDAYLERGPRSFAGLRGRFALALLDRRRAVAYALRDPMGSHPLFYRRLASDLLLAPAPETVARAGGRMPRIDRVEAAAFIARASPGRNSTLFEGVFRIPAGHLLEVRPEAFAITRYWEPQAAAGAEDPSTRLHELLLQAFDRYGSGRVAVFLSGGVDSAVVAAVAGEHARKHRIPPPVALSLAFPGSDADEESTQREVARRLGIELVLRTPEELTGGVGVLQAAHRRARDLPMSRPPELLDGPYELLARLGRDRGCRIVLSGAGGDEWLLPPPGYAADCVLRLDLHALVDLYRASAGYWPQSRRLDTARRVLWRGGIRAAGRSLVNTAAARLAPAVLARTRRSRASSRLPSWAVPDRQTRDLLVTRIAEATNQEPPHGALETQRRELLSGANSSTAREAAFETQSRVGVISQAPLLDPDVVGFLYHLPPHRLTEEGQAKAPARRLLARYLPDLVAAWPRTVYADSFWLNTVEEEAPSAWAASAEPLAGLADLGLLEPKTARSRLTGGGATPTELVTAWRALSLGWWIQGVGTRDDRL